MGETFYLIVGAVYTREEIENFCEDHEDYRDLYYLLDEIEGSTDLAFTMGFEYQHGKIVIGDVIEKRGYYGRDEEPKIDLIGKDLSMELEQRKKDVREILNQFDVYDGRPIVFTVNYSFS